MNYKIFMKALMVFLTLFCFVGVFLYMEIPCSSRIVDVVQAKEMPIRNNLRLINALQNGSLLKLENKEATVKCLGRKDEDRMRVNRDLLNEIPNGPLKNFKAQPGDHPSTVHYVWCGNKKFLFEDFLGFLSFVRTLRPIKIVFHYNELPILSFYHTWFQILTQSLPQLMLRQTDKLLRCNTVDSLNFGLEQLAASPGGGMYFGERAALTYVPLKWTTHDYFSYSIPGSTTSENIILYTKFGLLEKNETLEAFKSRILSLKGICVNADQFNKEIKAYEKKKEPSSTDDFVSPCLELPKEIYPKDIMNVDTPVASNLRRLFYGKSELLVAKPSQDPNDLIPLISHYINLASEPNKRPELSFSHYISVLSALYVAGFKRVYIHGDQVPTGQWWDKLKTENVTFVFIENIETVFQQKVGPLAHKSDILRLMILLKYGGVYQDRDVIWGNQVTEEIRRYPCVISYDWPKYDDWPSAGSNGIIIAKANSAYLQKFLEAFWFERDDVWVFNGVLMSYKVYEMNPETVYMYEKLQVICYAGVCHPNWFPDFIRPFNDYLKPTGNFSLDDALAYHFTNKPVPTLVSFEVIKRGNDIPAQLGQRVLKAIEKFGRLNLLVQ